MADISPTPADVLAYDGATTNSGTAGETITAGMSLYLASDGLLYKALADTAVHAACKGIALNGGAVDQPIKYLTAGGIDPGVAVVKGILYGVTDTAGGISGVDDRGSGDFKTILGFATTTSRIELNIWSTGYELA